MKQGNMVIKRETFYISKGRPFTTQNLCLLIPKTYAFCHPKGLLFIKPGAVESGHELSAQVLRKTPEHVLAT
jgi:hypothetical protein